MLRRSAPALLAFVVAGAPGCQRELTPAGDADGGAAPSPRVDSGQAAAPDGSVATGADAGPEDFEARALYARLCASCHGGRAEGRSPNPALDQWTRGRAALVAVIDTRMPPASPRDCQGTCAEKVADFILGSLQRPPPAVCDPSKRPPRQLRLLTRREYVTSVRALLGDCRSHRFEYTPPAGPTPQSVVVAGSFNGWSATEAAGAWPLTREGARFVSTRALPDGHHEYKFVIDGTRWIADPSNPRSAPDGFGGTNSVLDVACAGEPDPWTLTATFPPETRPPGFVFDDHAGSAAMTIVRLDEHWAAARALASGAAARLAAEYGCDADRPACAERLLDGLARRAFRRPLDATERARYRAHALAGATATDGVQQLLRALLASPSFLYRSELGVLDPARGKYVLTGDEVATALSFGLWGAVPDDTLLAEAAQGALSTPAGVEAAARRMLADPRARPVLETFAEQWLGLERVITADKRTEGHPSYDLALRLGLVAETSRLFSHVVLDGSHTLTELLTADYTFADAAIARLYGLPTPSGPGLVRVSLEGTPRRGILGHGSVLGAYAYSDQSSPVRRGVFVRERLLCQHLGTPPPNAGGIPDVDPNATTRERFQQHSADPFCASCHRAIDPIGFGFERFDALGKLRDSEAGRPIDARGDLIDLEALGAGTTAPFTSIAELAQLLADSRAAHSCVATQYYRFARGTLESEGDRCALDAVTTRLSTTDDLRELIIATYAAPAFLERE